MTYIDADSVLFEYLEQVFLDVLKDQVKPPLPTPVSRCFLTS
jgi:hypothetical protein